MTKTDRQPHLLLLLLASLVLFSGSFVIDQAFRWSNPLEGIANGLLHVMSTGLAWLIYGLVPGLITNGCYRWRGWRRFRTLAVIAPGIIACVLVVIGLILSPPTAARRLKQFTGADLPPSARDLRTQFTGGGLADYGDTYYFRCHPADTAALIEALHLRSGSPDDSKMFHRISSEWPDPSTWRGSSIYLGDRDDGGRFYYLLTDSSREQVYLFVGSL